MTIVWSGRGLSPAIVARLRPTWDVLFGRELDQILNRALINCADGIDLIDTVNQTSYETGYSQSILIGLYLASGLARQPGRTNVFATDQQDSLF